MTADLIVAWEAKEKEAKSKVAAEREPESAGGLTGELSEKDTEENAEISEDKEEDGRGA